MPTKLSNQEIQNQVGSLENWTFIENAIHKTFALPTFQNAIDFVRKVADLAEAEHHHPDFFIQYNKVTLTLSTHSVGGVSDKDMEMARKIDGIVG
ncbi:4a-hydroxytetrahydrobiopterin dehydratase [candidate division TA06 bacterium]|nr:4a-hydroxytetrahydrobiopterin dehydratase [candidate division TA06 bacterium]